MGAYDKITGTVLTSVKERPNPEYKNGWCRVRYKKVCYGKKPHPYEAAGWAPSGQMVRCIRCSGVKTGIQRPGKSLPMICTTLLGNFRRWKSRTYRTRLKKDGEVSELKALTLGRVVWSWEVVSAYHEPEHLWQWKSLFPNVLDLRVECKKIVINEDHRWCDVVVFCYDTGYGVKSIMFDQISRVTYPSSAASIMAEKDGGGGAAMRWLGVNKLEHHVYLTSQCWS